MKYVKGLKVDRRLRNEVLKEKLSIIRTRIVIELLAHINSTRLRAVTKLIATPSKKIF